MVEALKDFQLYDKSTRTGHGITICFKNCLHNNCPTYLASVLIEHFNMKQINEQSIQTLIDSLSQKSVCSNNTVQEIKIYFCQEFDENVDSLIVSEKIPIDKHLENKIHYTNLKKIFSSAI